MTTIAKRAPLSHLPANADGEKISDPDFMESLARGLSVMRAFGGARTRLTGAEVASLTGLSRAAARRCLHTLVVLGYARAAEGVFELTPAVLSLGQTYLGSASLAGLAQPVLQRLSEHLQEASAVAVLDGSEIVFVARAPTRRILSVEVTVGGRLPAAHTATGRVLLAHEDEAIRERFFAQVALPAQTPRSIVDKKELRAEIDRVRATGYAIVDQELELGLRSIALPIRRYDGGVVAAMNVGVQAARIDTKTMIRDVLPALRFAVSELEASLGATRSAVVRPGDRLRGLASRGGAARQGAE
jgi:IclR family transcriptional regulator, pca regulon regulatory protein